MILVYSFLLKIYFFKFDSFYIWVLVQNSLTIEIHINSI